MLITADKLRAGDTILSPFGREFVVGIVGSNLKGEVVVWLSDGTRDSFSPDTEIDTLGF